MASLLVEGYNAHDQGQINSIKQSSVYLDALRAQGATVLLMLPPVLRVVSGVVLAAVFH